MTRGVLWRAAREWRKCHVCRRSHEGAGSQATQSLLDEIAREHKRKDREKLVELRKKIRDAVGGRKLAIRAVVDQCRQQRRRLKEDAKKMRAILRQEIERERAEAQAACKARKAEARAAGISAAEQAEEEFRAERQLQRELRRIEGRMRAREKGTTTAAERRQESDDEVIGNIPREWVALFERVKRSIKGSPHRSRTEEFIEWVESHPQDLVEAQEELSRREIAKLLREERALAQAMRSPRRYKPTAEELASIPF